MDIGQYALQLHREGLSAEQIIQRKLINMPLLELTRMLRTLTDTRSEAKAALHGGAATIAHRLVEAGTPASDVAVMKGLRVIEPDEGTGLTIIIGAGSAVQVNIGEQPSLLPRESDT